MKLKNSEVKQSKKRNFNKKNSKELINANIELLKQNKYVIDNRNRQQNK